MGQFTLNLPDYSKNEVIMLIANQITSQQFNYTDLTSINTVASNSVSAAHQNAKDLLNTQLRAKYFECLHEICAKYRPQQLFSAFTSISFLEDILRLTLVADWASSRKAHEIIQLLFDKYQTLAKVKKLKPSLFNDFLTKGIATIHSKLSKSTNSTLYQKNVSTTSLNKATAQEHHAENSAKTSLTSLHKQTRNQSSDKNEQELIDYNTKLIPFLNQNLDKIKNLLLYANN